MMVLVIILVGLAVGNLIGYKFAKYELRKRKRI